MARAAPSSWRTCGPAPGRWRWPLSSRRGRGPCSMRSADPAAGGGPVEVRPVEVRPVEDGELTAFVRATSRAFHKPRRVPEAGAAQRRAAYAGHRVTGAFDGARLVGT